MPSRRRLILASLGAVGALTLGWSVLPPRQRLRTAEPLPASPDQRPLNGWLKIGADDRVIVALARSEMGQGVSTALAMVLADELDADWSRVSTEMAPIDPIYYNQAAVVDSLPMAFHPDDQGSLRRAATWLTEKVVREIGVMATGGSTSIKDLWQPMREAGASARAMLVSAAAQAWRVPADQIDVTSGTLRHAASGRQARFGEMAERAARQAIPDRVVLKDPSRFTLIGRPLPRRDSAAKSDGSAVFGLDVRADGMLHASVIMSPTLGGRVASFDAAAAETMPGVRKVVRFDGLRGGSGGIAAIAATPWQAMQAAARVQVRWDDGPAATVSSAGLMRELWQALADDDGWAYHRTGDAAGALRAAERTIRADYSAPLLAHATLEPQNATVLFEPADRRATVWAPTQIPDLARAAAAQALDLPADRVEVRVTLLGGGFGRRLDVDFIAQAAQIARALPHTPVQTFWSREQDMTHDLYRPPCVARCEAGFDAHGRPVAWRATSAGPSIVHQYLKRNWGLPGIGPDKTVAEGAFDASYEWPSARVAHVVVDTAIPVGFWRAVGHSHQAFFKESFVDECAAALGQDPVAFRAGLLQRHPRPLAVLRRAAELAGWGTPLAPAPDGAPRARGIALHESHGSVVAQVAEVSVSPADQRIRVHRVVAVIDCGTPVNPNIIRQQMDSAVVFGLTAALYGEITIEQGRVQQTNFHQQPLLRFDECPRIETEIVASDLPPQGVGEPGTPSIAPAVANALFALTGKRLRSLPLRLT